MKESPEQKLESAEILLELYKVKVLNTLNFSNGYRHMERFIEQEIIVKEAMEKVDEILSNK